ncbi:two-component system, NtrC family, response regulator PilR [Thermotomaculum hydrothermale]|uniref:Two-component system, NtrC family, response regulator PilR n=1 Tax=Thermotomaculum hydrothermale TaxID=981385 RepID=A0A7R6PDY9_9BACT|nr:sigma-54 dependent transcriptional regulator [Thermotomaculum hydrothermale]BBB31984.1 two-component system, NtrC family, response regulator PilR [Thermotomaculum hydrothermale]
MEGRILVVEDEHNLLLVVKRALSNLNCEVETATNASIAQEYVLKKDFDLIICDIKLPGMSGIEFLKWVRDKGIDSEFIIMTAFATTDTAIEALRMGACDYLIKPFSIDELRLIVKRTLDVRRLKKENILLKTQVFQDVKEIGLIGESEKIKKVVNLVKKVAPTDATVLITGESGVGKELVAKAIHLNSLRKDNKFLSLNCAALPETLLESELFGYEKGAFTGAEKDKPGLFEMANKGTLFLDEIGEMPLQMQAKLLRVLQDFKIRRLGGREDISVDVRIICATNRDIEKEVKEGKFREDLYYRINVFHIPIPPLRERRSDIPILLNYFVDKFSRKLGIKKPNVSKEFLNYLENYHFPGNVRELENIVERALTIMEGDTLLPSHLPEKILTSQNFVQEKFEVPEEGVDIEKILDGIRLQYMEEAMKKTGGKMKDAAKLLNMSFRSFRYYYHKLKKD